MMRCAALVLAALVAGAAALPAAAESPAPHPTGTTGLKKTPVTTLENPGAHAKPRTLSGKDCIGGGMANAAQTEVNPITGKAQAAPIVSVPITKGGGSVAAATAHAQQTQACVHTR